MDVQSQLPADLLPPGLEGTVPTDELSIIALFLQADLVVKTVMILLCLASIACWAVILDKGLRIARLARETRTFEAAIARDATVLPGRLGAVPDAILSAGRVEWRDGSGDESRSERRDRIERSMRAALSTAVRDFEGGLPFLATVGSSAPFIGLFGTVWGIMNSFTAIARSNDTSLAVVAPGIAEALFATAIGLVAAIPAVIAYNKLTTALARQAQRLATAIGTLSNRMARTDLQPRAEAAE
jgi:TolQ protein